MFRLGRRRRTPGLTVLTLEGPSALPRVGIVAGKKVGNAVNRNRAKRRLREAASRAGLEAHTDYILIAGPECNDVGFTDLVETISGRTSGA
ncbi:MAG: ribonuclease P protein component [Acidimicrobiia bacterium]|nr:ribonuclease P protein component [Acidimicrobiia bacterium]MBT8215915.1 ribonuclease P protein component [Acidimicrobiia bacterium]NNF11299.1 ribonuclease P protein component [Acidimicrobiia bacterium]NNL48447.1 ribonuclease P protein component [Acidimicrobiia bacterium]NNL68386.1 ribonuclease P protein component [Acidimicrobiia bacterium]